MGSKGHVWSKSKYDQLLKDITVREEKRKASGTKKRIGWIQPKEGYNAIFLGNDLTDIVFITLYFILWYLFIFGIYVLFFWLVSLDSFITLYCFFGFGVVFVIGVACLVAKGSADAKKKAAANSAVVDEETIAI